jgi:hypothetical protein
MDGRHVLPFLILSNRKKCYILYMNPEGVEFTEAVVGAC